MKCSATGGLHARCLPHIAGPVGFCARCEATHDVFRASSGLAGRVWCCAKCTASRSATLRKLLRPCAGGATRARAAALRRIGQGHDPKPLEPRSGCKLTVVRRLLVQHLLYCKITVSSRAPSHEEEAGDGCCGDSCTACALAAQVPQGGPRSSWGRVQRFYGPSSGNAVPGFDLSRAGATKASPHLGAVFTLGPGSTILGAAFDRLCAGFRPILGRVDQSWARFATSGPGSSWARFHHGCIGFDRHCMRDASAHPSHAPEGCRVRPHEPRSRFPTKA